jgi:serine/threonine protein kinase
MGSGSSTIRRPYYDSSSSFDSLVNRRRGSKVEDAEREHRNLLRLTSVPHFNPNILKVPYILKYPFIDYHLQKKLSHHSTSSVYRCLFDPLDADDDLPDEDPHLLTAHSHRSSKLYAIKEIYINQLTLWQSNDLRYELNLLSHCTPHPNLLHLYAIYEPSLLNVNFYVVMEDISGGDMLSALSSSVTSHSSGSSPSKGKGSLEATVGHINVNHVIEGFSLDEIKYYFQQIASALEFLHSHRVTHNYLIPENILFRRKYKSDSFAPSSSSHHSHHSGSSQYPNIVKIVGFDYLESHHSLGNHQQNPRRPLKKAWNDPHFFPPELRSLYSQIEVRFSKIGIDLKKLRKESQSGHISSNESLVSAEEQEQSFQLHKAFDIWLFHELFYFFISGNLPFSLGEKASTRSETVCPCFLFFLLFYLRLLCISCLFVFFRMENFFLFNQLKYGMRLMKKEKVFSLVVYHLIL